MRDMISVASGFQYSVNIGYDLGSDNKLKSFIPTKSALSLLEDILLARQSDLIGSRKGFDWCIWQGQVSYRADNPLYFDEEGLDFVRKTDAED